MLTYLKNCALVCALSASFFVFGLALGSGLFRLTLAQIVTVVIAGTVCGITVLLVAFSHSKKQMEAVRDRLAA